MATVKTLKTERGMRGSLATLEKEMAKMFNKKRGSMNDGELDISNPDTLDALLTKNENVKCDSSILIRNLEKYA